MRLADLTPDAVGDAAHDACLSHAQRVAFACGYDLVPGGAGLSDLRFATRLLTHYALTGEKPGDAPVEEYYLSLAPLYTRAADGATFTVEDLDEGADPSTPWGVVLRACTLRDRLADGGDVTPAELALLASVVPQYVRQQIAAGEIRTRKHRDDSRPGKAASVITATEARRWLSGRGVQGY